MHPELFKAFGHVTRRHFFVSAEGRLKAFPLIRGALSGEVRSRCRGRALADVQICDFISPAESGRNRDGKNNRMGILMPLRCAELICFLVILNLFCYTSLLSTLILSTASCEWALLSFQGRRFYSTRISHRNYFWKQWKQLHRGAY